MAAMQTHRRATPALPQELVDIVIDELRDDRKSLATCVLISRQWTHTARQHLFRKVNVTGSRNIFMDFLHFLQECPNVCAVIREISVARLLKNSRDDVPAVCYHVLGDVLRLLPQLSSISFNGTQLQCLCPHPIPVLPTYHIDSLSITDMSCQSNTLFSLFPLFSDIGSLTIRDVQDVKAIASALPALIELLFVKPLVKVHTAHIALAKGHAIGYSNITGCFPQLCSSRALTTLEVHSTSAQDLQALGSLIHWGAPSLESLRLHLASSFMHSNLSENQSFFTVVAAHADDRY